MIDTIVNMGQTIPKFVNEGNAARWIMPFAMEVCQGIGYDIGCHSVEWSLPNSIPIDPSIDDRYNDLNLPEGEVDYIFSSHCLEHCNNWVKTLRYWTSKLKSGGVLFLYLPTYDKVSWRPWINFTHNHILSPKHIKEFLEFENVYDKIFVSKTDLNYSFAAMCEKK